MAQYRYNFADDLPNKQLSPSSLANAIADTDELPMTGGIAMYLKTDEFAVAFASDLTDEQKVVLDDVIASHMGEGPDTIPCLAARQADEEAARAEAEAAEAEA